MLLVRRPSALKENKNKNQNHKYIYFTVAVWSLITPILILSWFVGLIGVFMIIIIHLSLDVLCVWPVWSLVNGRFSVQIIIYYCYLYCIFLFSVNHFHHLILVWKEFFSKSNQMKLHVNTFASFNCAYGGVRMHFYSLLRNVIVLFIAARKKKY